MAPDASHPDFWSDFMNIASLIIDGLALGVGLAMLTLAVRGLTIWRDEKRAVWRAEAARNLLRALYNFRNSVRFHKHGAPWAVYYAAQYPKTSFENGGTPFPHQNIEKRVHEMHQLQSEIDQAMLELQVIEEYPWIRSLRIKIGEIMREMNNALSSFIGEAFDALDSPNQYRTKYIHLFTHGEEPPGWPPPTIEDLNNSIRMCDDCIEAQEVRLRKIMQLESEKDLLPW